MFEWYRKGSLWVPRMEGHPVRFHFETRVVRRVSLEEKTRRWYVIVELPPPVRVYVHDLEASAREHAVRTRVPCTLRSALLETSTLPLKLVYQGKACCVPCVDDRGVRLAWAAVPVDTELTVDVECIGFDPTHASPVLMWNARGGRVHRNACAFVPGT